MRKLPPHVETFKTKLDRLCDGIGAGVFLASIVYMIFQWSRLPDEIPAHFNISGEVDRYGSPFMLLLLTMIGVGLWALLGFLERHPEWHNYPARLNETNAARFYQSSRMLLNRIKNISLVLFAYLQWEMVRVALGATDGLSKFGTGGLLVLLFAVIIAGVIRQSKIK